MVFLKNQLKQNLWNKLWSVSAEGYRFEFIRCTACILYNTLYTAYIEIVNKLRAVVASLLSRAVLHPPQSKTKTEYCAELQLSPSCTEKMCKIQFWHSLFLWGIYWAKLCEWLWRNNSSIWKFLWASVRFPHDHIYLGKGVIILVLTIAKQRSSRCIFSSRLAHSQFHASPWQCYILRKPWRQIFSQNKLTKMKHSLLNGDLYHMFWEH